MQHGLSFEQAPPISVPYRFFLTAPLFGVAAGLLLAWSGSGVLASRWTPGVLAVVHLLVAGFMLQVMCGALLQFVAVVAGANIWRPRLVAALLHPSLTLAAVVLAVAFLFGRPALFLLAAAIFLLALGPFLLVMTIALLRTPARGASIHVLRLALFGLLVTLALGLFLTAVLGGLQSSRSLFTLIDVHLAWGLGGWALMLVVGVSFMVVPMFQLTPAYPAWLAWLLPTGLIAALCLWSLQLLPGVAAGPSWPRVVLATGLLLTALYALATLWLQSRRRRRKTDVTFWFWRGAMMALLALAVSGVVFQLVPGWGGDARASLWLGILAVPGVFLSVIMGMLYKIMPFLNWLHLQQEVGIAALAPNMNQMIPPRAMRAQMWAQFAALALLLVAVFWPALTSAAGIALAVSCLGLQWNLLGAARVYLRARGGAQAGTAPAGH
jgi:hypothetical protein